MTSPHHSFENLAYFSTRVRGGAGGEKVTRVSRADLGDMELYVAAPNAPTDRLINIHDGGSMMVRRNSHGLRDIIGVSLPLEHETDPMAPHRLLAMLALTAYENEMHVAHTRAVGIEIRTPDIAETAARYREVFDARMITRQGEISHMHTSLQRALGRSSQVLRATSAYRDGYLPRNEEEAV